ncbi:hypothetical protein A6K25_07145 [Alteromonas stellipolaris]|uniref:alginate O-acetyltransferase AlgX-related protein n=1 Tax=Alteromonas stellipolaris TaxID=233316 RepID=UPI0007B44BCF|nr:hypothetical protein [Alteromonas stellipolaris]ANB21078.1 hypothetical protein A6K25_07145 [Alteromonas stellipolaris]
MAVFTISVKQMGVDIGDKFKWCLDEPSNGAEHEGNQIEQEGIRIKGWFLKKLEAEATLVLLDGCEIVPLVINTERADVIEKVATIEANFQQEVLCGFDHTLVPKSSNIAIAIVHDSRLYVIYELCIEGVFKILEGEQKWLFLDNDTNKSVEQFTGKTKLSWKEKKNWDDYASTFSSLTLSQAGRSVFLIAPSKEFVVNEHYPFKKSKHTPLDQLTKLVDDSFGLVTPINALKQFEERTFRVCDTHWSCHGARVATMEVAKKLGLDCAPIEDIFKKDVYVERVMAGDLGSKIYPTQRHAEDFLTTFNYNRVVVYDNNLPNFGRAFILDNPDALNKKCLLVFGSSSVYSMFNYLARIFRTVVFFHTAGNIDKELVEKIAPDYLLAQSNARFVVKAPSFDIKISDYVLDKRKRLVTAPPITSRECSPQCEELQALLSYFENSF